VIQKLPIFQDDTTHLGLSDGAVGAPTPSADGASGAACERGDVDAIYKLHRQFDRIGRLVGDGGMKTLFEAHVLVVGLGGVGSFAAEALARSGVGRLTLVDFDRVCVTNINRQLHALRGTVGKPKASVFAERLRLIHPAADVVPLTEFYSKETSARILETRPDFVVDAIDNFTAKCHLIASSKQLGIPLVSSMGASGRLDPTALQVADLAHTRVDPMALDVRRILRREHGFPKEGPFGVPAVFSTEKAQMPFELHYDGGKGFRCVCPGGKNDLHSCDERAVIYGTAAFVTGAFGLACAGVVVRTLTGRQAVS
jgi:tRNA A37 threonylcarbamoyladenosine dehydratase